MSSFRLFDRRYELRIGNTPIRSLDIEFDVRRSLKKEANTADITVYGLSKENRQIVEDGKDIPIELDAGYASAVHTIFKGRISRAYTEVNGPEVMLKIEATDGRIVRGKRINKSFKKGTPLKTVVQEAVKSLGLGEGNLSRVTAVLFDKVGRVLPGGTVLSGSAEKELDGLLSSADLEYSVQSETLQILPKGKPLESTAVLLGADFGLIDAPYLTNEGQLVAKTLMIPDLYPGRKVQMAPAENVQGIFRVEVARYSGGTNQNDWGIEIECNPVTT